MAKKKKISRQETWQKKQILKGNCRICGKKRSRKSNLYCLTHLLDSRKRSHDYFLSQKQAILTRESRRQDKRLSSDMGHFCDVGGLDVTF